MSLNKRWVILDQCVSALKQGKLKEYFGKSDMLYFSDTTCVSIYNLHVEGKTDEEIIKLIKL
jgi:hypothetical protein